jgi:hypothetical protein
MPPRARDHARLKATAKEGIMHDATCRRAASWAVIAAMTTVLPGCGTIFGGSRQTIQAASAPDGATLTTTPETGEFTTPASITLEKKKDYTLKFSKEGYKPASVAIEHRINGGILILDILLFPVGVIVDAVTGGWYKLSPEMASVALTKQSADVAGPDEIRVTLGTVEKGDSLQLKAESDATGVAMDVEVRE